MASVAFRRSIALFCIYISITRQVRRIRLCADFHITRRVTRVRDSDNNDREIKKSSAFSLCLSLDSFYLCLTACLSTYLLIYPTTYLPAIYLPASIYLSTYLLLHFPPARRPFAPGALTSLFLTRLRKRALPSRAPYQCRGNPRRSLFPLVAFDSLLFYSPCSLLFSVSPIFCLCTDGR